MATGDFFGNLKQKARALYNNFFYEGEEAPAPQPMQEEAYPQQEQPYQQPQQAQQPYQQNAYQAPYAQGYQQNQAAYQQQAYQQPQQNAYQGNMYQQPQQAQQPQGHRNRRAQQHQENNVVDFGAYQQQNYQQPQQNAYQPQAQPAVPQQEQGQQPAAPAASFSARVINARGMGDCRSAITLLRNGDAVIIVLENVTDPAEMRRLVDTLSGACYSLTATITKLSRYGAYLLAPQTMAVYTDQITNQMNGAPGRPQARNYQPGNYAAAPQRPAYQPQQQAPQMNYAPQQGFTQRAAAPEEAAQPFYARTAPQQAQAPAFSTQPTAYGYVPDEMEAVDQ